MSRQENIRRVLGTAETKQKASPQQEHQMVPEERTKLPKQEETTNNQLAATRSQEISRMEG